MTLSLSYLTAFAAWRLGVLAVMTRGVLALMSYVEGVAKFVYKRILKGLEMSRYPASKLKHLETLLTPKPTAYQYFRT